MITKINTIDVFVFFFLNENLNIMFLHQEGLGSRRGGGGNQNKDIGIANISWGLHYNFNLITIHFAFLIKFKETKENRIDGGRG